MAATALRSAAEPAADSFDRFAGACAVAAAALGVLYAVAFLVLRSQALSGLCLALGALLTTAALTALHARLVRHGAPLANWGLLLAAAGAVGAIAHGGYDLANALHPPGVTNADLPSQVDPRGALTFGLSGLGLACLAVLMARSGGGRFPRALAWLGALSAALSVTLYLGRLVVLDPASPLIALPALAEGFVVNPLWYAWLGVALWRTAPAR
jgi:hypothetical protein